jgi:hypothetical protein
MKISMYQVSIPVFVHNLKNLSEILKKGAAHAVAKKIDESVLINARLFPDMLPLSRQVQIACDAVKAGAARLAEVEVPSHPDTETSFAQLQERISKTIDFLETINQERIDGKEDLKISYVQRDKENNFIGLPYLLNFVLPNLYFHITTAYAILRHSGVEVGKKDYLGKY